jgi:hypothetical protein
LLIETCFQAAAGGNSNGNGKSTTSITDGTDDNGSCPLFAVDFASVSEGQYVTNELQSDYLVTIEATGGYTPGGAARVFNTANPGTTDNGDPDLGSPNSKCDGGGPGKGNGGAPGSSHSNCVPLGNVLIVQEDDKDQPDDNGGGGTIKFSFTRAAKIQDISILDIDDGNNVPRVDVSTFVCIVFVLGRKCRILDIVFSYQLIFIYFTGQTI